MRKLIIPIAITAIAAALIIPNVLKSKNGNYTTTIKKVVLNLSKNSKMDYQSTLKLENGESRTLKGKLAINESGNFYDSSNARLLLYNDKWFLNIDHENKMVDAFYLPKVQKQLEQMGDFSMNDLFLGNIKFIEKLAFDDEQLGDGRYWLHSKSKDSTKNVYDVSLLFDKEHNLREYKGVARIPLSPQGLYDSLGNRLFNKNEEYGELTFRCFNIDTVDQSIFDEARLVQYKNEGAYLKKYKKYKMFKK